MEKQERFYFDVWIALLSTLAGMVNVVTLLLFLMPTTHFTGNITQFVLSFNEEEWGTMLHLLGMILCFSGGGVLSGFLFSKKKFEPTKRYGVLLMMFGCFYYFCLDYATRNGYISSRLLSEHKMECSFTTMELSYEHLTLQAI